MENPDGILEDCFCFQNFCWLTVLDMSACISTLPNRKRMHVVVFSFKEGTSVQETTRNHFIVWAFCTWQVFCCIHMQHTWKLLPVMTS